MDFYQKKKLAAQTVDKMYEQNLPLVQIYFLIESTYGLSARFVDKRIEKIVEIKRLQNASLS